MTAKQRETWSLYVKGTAISDIAQITGRSKSSVYSMLKTIEKRAKTAAGRRSVLRKNSPSCFTCPLKDCVVSESTVTKTNLLPGDMGARV